MKNKKIYLEFIRAFSMLLVIFNHTGTRGFFLFSIATDSIFYPFYLFISVACKVAVPLYWMISGALLLPREESIKRVYQHRVLRMVLVLVVFSLFYYAKRGFYQQRGFALIYAFLITLYTDRFSNAFWFIYSYIGMLMMLPLLRKMVKALPRSYFLYLFILVFSLRGVLPIIEYLGSTLPAQIGLDLNTELNVFSLNQHIAQNLFSQSVLYFIAGYYFDSFISTHEITRRGSVRWICAGFIAIIITCLMTHYKIQVTGLSSEGVAQTFYNNLICIPTFAIFYCTRWFFLNHQITGAIQKAIQSLGSCAFGIMLCEEALRSDLDFIYKALAPKLHRLPACLIWVLAVYSCGYAITLCMKRIPGLKKII